MELVTPSLGLLVWTSVIFLTLFFILSKFAWRPIVQALNDREKFIEDALSSAEKAKSEMALLKSENENLLQQARLERDRILKEAQQVSSNIIADAKEKSVVEANKIVENARLQIINEKNAALTELRNLVVTTSIQISEQILKKSLATNEDQNSLIEAYLKETKFN